MEATMGGRVTEVSVDHNTATLTTVRIDSSRGLITVFKPDGWDNQDAIAAAIGKNVEVRVILTVMP